MRGKNRIFNRNLLFLTLILTVVVITAVFIHKQIKADDFSVRFEKNEYVTICFNVNNAEKLMFTELIILSTKTDKAAVFNIPGNYGSIIESLSRIERLDILFNPGNPDKMLKKIESIFNIPVDYYINIDRENLVKSVDMLSGIEMFIANPVEIINENEIVLLPSGSSVLDGEKMLVYLESEFADESDADLVGRWHKFIQGFIRKTAEKSSYLENDEIYDIFYSFFNTDLNRESFRSFLRQLKKIDSERMILQRILGDRKNIDNQILLFPYYNGNLLKETVKQTLSSISSDDVISDEELRIGLEILNGTSIPGIAGRTAHFFTNLGYDVVATRNAEKNDYEKTLVISRSDNPGAAQKIASIIRCTNIETGGNASAIENDGQTESAPSGNSVDVTIILGKDFDGRYCK